MRQFLVDHFQLNWTLQPSLATDTVTITVIQLTLQNATNANNHVKIMNVTLSSLQGQVDQASTLVTLGENAAWQNNSVFLSNSTSIMPLKHQVPSA